MFTAVFGSQYRDRICADNGADRNIHDKDTLRGIEAAGVDVAVQSLNQPLVFDMAAVNADGGRAKLICTKTVSIDTEIHIRHGCMLRLRNLKWIVTEQRVCDQLIGRPVLKALGTNTWDLLAAAEDQFCGSVDADRVMGSFAESGDGRMSRVMEGVFHADGGDDVEEHLDESREWCDIVRETEEEWDNALKTKLSVAERNGLYADGKM